MAHSLKGADDLRMSLHRRNDLDGCMATFAFTILPFIPLAAWILLVGWSPNSTEGEVLEKVPVPLLARLKMLGIPLFLGMVVLIVGLIMDRVTLWVAFALLPIYLIVVSIPVSYTLTTAGIRTGKGAFRRWTEFAGVRRSPSGAILQGGQRASSYPIFLSGNREDDEFVHTLKNLVRDSYKGKTLVRNTRDSQSMGDTSTTSSINH